MNHEAEIEMAVFEAARHIVDPAARDAFLQRVYPCDPGEVERMHDMLKAESDSEAWFDSLADTRGELAAEIASTERLELSEPVTNIALASPRIDDRYTVLECLGEGGGGRVFRAEQSEPVRRDVAVKFLQVGLLSPGFREAFKRECQTLALLNHPNIASIYDAGLTESGIPYCVMELVGGVRITRDCDSRRDTLRARIGLFLQVCSAITHAHQKGFLHRDIKPSNILMTTVDGVPCPKVIDFGIAAAMSTENAEPSVPAGTPGYQCPEQRDPRTDIDTRADVFSLGIVLRELLAGAIPGVSVPTIGEAASAWLSRQPLAPLHQLAGQRGLEPPQLIAAVRGDLDAIIAKATAPNRVARYQTVEGFANDLRRYLEDKPVRAVPQSGSYVLGKFVRRNRLACSLASTAVLAVVFGGVFSFSSFLQEREARRTATRAQAVAADLLQAAESRETVTQAAILLSQGRTKEADALLRKHPLSEISPSREAAYVFRFLGERNAILGRWTQASDCFKSLAQANRSYPLEKIASSWDLLMSLPAFLEAGDERAYESLRANVLANAESVRDVTAAERIVKSCLLRPAKREDLERMRPLALILEKNTGHYRALSADSNHNRWFTLALAFFEYRQGNFESALEWSRAALIPTKQRSWPQTLQAAANWLGSMSCWQLGRREETRAFANEARRITIQYGTSAVVNEVGDYDSTQGNWYAWAVARILQREADALSSKAPANPAVRPKSR